jgi:undecaprenyl-diphosphatase
MIAASSAWSWFVMEPGFKYIVKRPRPSSELIQVFDLRPGFGFPSGAAIHSAGIVCVLLYVSRKNNLLNRMAFGAATSLGVVFCVAIGIARIVAGAHWSSDIFGGWLMAAWIITAVALIDKSIASN